jgi:hypothetical protein
VYVHAVHVAVTHAAGDSVSREPPAPDEMTATSCTSRKEINISGLV